MGGWGSARARLSCMLLAAIGILGLASGAVLYRFIFPRPRLVEAGPIAAFPPAADPYLLEREFAVFIVNDGEQIFALDPIDRESIPTGCRVQWDSQVRVFVDPCRGDHFDLYGRPVRIANKELQRYPVKIEGEFLYVLVP